MLVVNQVIPGSAADGQLRVGDILVKVGGDLRHRVRAPGDGAGRRRWRGRCSLAVERNGQSLDIVAAGAGSARRHARRVPAVRRCRGACAVAAAGAPLQPADRVACMSPTRATCSVPRLFRAPASSSAWMTRRCRRWTTWRPCWRRWLTSERAAVRFFTFEDPATSKLRVIRMDRRWFPAQRCRRDDSTGIWPCRALAGGPRGHATVGALDPVCRAARSRASGASRPPWCWSISTCPTRFRAWPSAITTGPA